MKIVTLTFTMKFDDDTPDDVCYSSAIECQGQSEWNDNEIKLEHKEGSSDND